MLISLLVIWMAIYALQSISVSKTSLIMFAWDSVPYRSYDGSIFVLCVCVGCVCGLCVFVGCVCVCGLCVCVCGLCVCVGCVCGLCVCVGCVCVCGLCVWVVCVGCVCGLCVWVVCVGCVCGCVGVCVCVRVKPSLRKVQKLPCVKVPVPKLVCV